MALKSYNPTSPAQRGLILVDKSSLWKGKPVKALTEGLTKKGGRNNHGRVTAFGQGGGHVGFHHARRRRGDDGGTCLATPGRAGESLRVVVRLAHAHAPGKSAICPVAIDSSTSNTGMPSSTR